MIAFSAGDIVLVTGASSGIGRATALLLNRLGATVLASGRSRERLEAMRAECVNPARIHLEPLDLCANLDGLPAWVSELRARYGKLRGLAFCAGQTWNLPMSQFSAEAGRLAFDVCCLAPLLTARGFCDRRNCTGAGAAIVFVAAAAACEPNPGQGAYGAAKAGLVCAARCLSKEVAPRKIRVNCVSPGLVATPMMEETVRELGDDFVRREEAAYPLGFGQPENVADTVAFLLSDAAGWMTGQNLLLSGGR